MSTQIEEHLNRFPGLGVDAPRRNFAADALLRFLLIYFFLSNWVWMDQLIINPTRPIGPVFDAVFGRLARWSGYHLFHLTGALEPSSFRDTRYLYLLLFVLAVTSVALTAAWTIFDRPGRYVRPAYNCMRVWIRFTLAYMILIYGMNKIFMLQFTFPSLQRLIETFGESSPMGLLWTYVGYSAAMTMLSGFAEATGSVLLFFRRTAPLGALICAIMMANVTLMNFCYDVSVKMLAAHFLAMSLFLLAHDAHRLAGVLVFNRPALARNLEEDSLPISSPRIRKYLPALKTLVILYSVLPVIPRTYKGSVDRGALAPHVPLYGLYKVKSVEIDGAERPLLVTDGSLWEYVVIEQHSEITFRTMDGSIVTADAKYNPASSTLAVHQRDRTSPQLDLTVTPEGPSSAANPPQPAGLAVTGTEDKHHIVEHLQRVDPNSFTLVNRGFHWITEHSFYR